MIRTNTANTTSPTQPDASTPPAQRHAYRPRRHPAGLSLVEVVLSLAIVGGLMVSVFTAVGLAAKRGFSASQRSEAVWLAHDLLAEIGAKPCVADAGNILTLTPLDVADLSGITRGGSRSAFDSVFDYANWTSSPPVDAAGNAIAGATGWTRAVVVRAINPATLATRTANPDAARITVTAIGPNGARHSATIIRTAAFDELRGIQPNSDLVPAVVTGAAAAAAGATGDGGLLGDLIGGVGSILGGDGDEDGNGNGNGNGKDNDK